MKRALLFLLLYIVSNKLFCQVDALDSGKDSVLSYSGTVQASGISKNDLFFRARDWLSNNFETLKIQDKETGELSARGSITSEVTVNFLGAHTATAKLDFMLTIFVQDGMYSYIITSIDNTKINNTDKNGVFGRLYQSSHCTVKNLGLSQKNLDKAYQSLKDGFDKSEKELTGFLKATMTAGN